MAFVLPVVRVFSPPEVFSQLELPAWGTKVEMGPAESTASTFAQVQSNTGFTKPFPSKYIIIHHKVTGEEIR